jgi:hypothetical protein
MTSWIAVSSGPALTAGSIFRFLNISGDRQPMIPATEADRANPRPVVRPNRADSDQVDAMIPMTNPEFIAISNADADSLRITWTISFNDVCAM